MATYTKQSDHNSNYSLRLELWEDSTNIANNTSLVKYQLWLDSSYARFEDWDVAYNLYFDGSAAMVDTTQRLSMPSTRRQPLLLHEGQVNITHDGSGARTLPWRCGISATGASYVPGTIAMSGELVLSWIPRASSISADRAMYLGQYCNLVIDRKSDAFRHTVSYVWGTMSGVIADKTPDTIIPWTVPVELGAMIPDKWSDTGAFVLTTYYGNTAIAETRHPMTLNVPDYSLQATISVAINKGGVPWDGVLVRGYGTVSYQASGSGAYGSTLASCAFSCAGQSISGFSGTTGVFPTAGTIYPQALLTDSRGKQEAANTVLTVEEYGGPYFANVYAYRCDVAGNPNAGAEYIKVMAAAGGDSIGGRNTITTRFRARPSGGSYGGYTILANGAEHIFEGYSASTSYDIELSCVDTIGNERRVESTILSSRKTFHLKPGGNGGAFGKWAEEDDLLDVAWNQRIRKDLTVDGVIRSRGGFPLIPGADFNQAMDAGVYWAMNTDANNPAGDWGVLEVMGSVEKGTAMQRITTYQAGDVGSRIYVNGAWGNWVWK